MTNENPYISPQTQGVAPIAEAEAVKGEPRLSARQATWIVHTQYALRTFYVFVGLFTLGSIGQLAFVFVMDGPGSAFPISDEVRLYTAVTGVMRIVLGSWIVVALHRFDLALKQVRRYDAAPLAVHRALRMCRNAWLSLAGSVVILFLTGLLLGIWIAVARAVFR
jgi:hypothetical protein